MEINNTLKFAKIEKTIERLSMRISERFPSSGLGKTCRDFLQFTQDSQKNIVWIEQPIFWIRAITFSIFAISLISIIYGFTLVDFSVKNTLSELATVAEASINNIILLGAAFFFLFTLENRFKRIKAIKLLNEIRGFAHVVDMHQLTKDPHSIKDHIITENSPERDLSEFELQRYLDYSSEFLSLVGKVAALYSQRLPDEIVVQSSSEIENLCSNINNKIWQKLMILSIEQEKEPTT